MKVFGEKRVGVIQIIEHPALNQTRDGLLAELEEKGFKNSKNLLWLWESANGTPAQAIQIAQKYVGQNVDVIVAIGTTAAQAASSVAKGSGIPVVFTSVSSPKEAKLIQTKDGPDITGVSNQIGVEKQFKLFLRLLPKKRPLRLGIIFNPSETNSVSNNTRMTEVTQTTFTDIELKFASANKTSEVTTAAQSLVGKVDAYFVNNDNTALAAFENLATVARAHKIPAFVSDVDLVKRGALGAYGPNQYELGRQTARIVVSLLKKEKKAKDIPFQYPEKEEEQINQDVAKELSPLE